MTALLTFVEIQFSRTTTRARNSNANQLVIAALMKYASPMQEKLTTPASLPTKKNIQQTFNLSTRLISIIVKQTQTFMGALLKFAETLNYLKTGISDYIANLLRIAVPKIRCALMIAADLIY